MVTDETTQTIEDTSQDGDSSQETAGGTSDNGATTPSTDESVQKAVNDALSKAGRDAKSLATLKETIEKQAKEIAEDRAAWIKQQRDAELEAAQDNPDLLDAIKVRHKAEERHNELVVRETALKQREAELDIELAEYRSTQKSGMFMLTASKYGLDASALQEASERLGLTDEDKIDALAQTMKPGTTTNTQRKADSGKMSGGGTGTPKTGDDLIAAGLRKLKTKKN